MITITETEFELMWPFIQVMIKANDLNQKMHSSLYAMGLNFESFILSPSHYSPIAEIILNKLNEPVDQLRNMERQVLDSIGTIQDKKEMLQEINSLMAEWQD